LSDDGKRLATWGTTNSPMASADWSKMQIWDVATQEEVATIKLDSFPLSVALSPDGKTVAAAGTNGRVSLWSADTGQRTATLLGRTGLGRKLAFTPSGKTILTLCFDGAVQRWSVADAAMIDVVPAPAIPHLIVEKLIVAGEDRALVTGYSWSRSVAWEVPSGKLLMSAEGHGDPIRTLAFREGGKEIVTGSGLSEIYRWDSSSGKRLPDIRIAQAPQYQDPGLKLSATGTRAILSSGQVFDTANGTELFGFKPISSETRHHPRISPCGTKLCVVVTDVTPTPKSAWAFGLDLMTGKQLGDVPIPSSGGAFVSAAISPDGSKVFAAMSKRQDGKVSFSAAARNLKDGKVLSNFDFEEGGYQYPEVVMASDNTTAVVGTPTGRLYAVNYVAGTTLRDLSLKQRTFTCSPVFDSDGKRLAYAVAPNLNETATVIFVVNPATGKTLNEFRGHSKTVTSLLFAPDGKTLVSGSDDTTALVWDLSAGKPTGN
jgi:WD40 repeat protein